MAERLLTHARQGFWQRRAMSSHGLDAEQRRDIATVVDGFEKFVDAYETVLDQYEWALREIDRLNQIIKRYENDSKQKGEQST